jgi:hypothetical protein
LREKVRKARMRVLVQLATDCQVTPSRNRGFASRRKIAEKQKDAIIDDE